MQLTDATSVSDRVPAVHIVAGDVELRTALGHLLRSAGYRVRQFGSAQEFAGADWTTCSGCLVLDVQLPGGVSGLDLQAQLLASGVAMPVVFMTGHGDVALSVRAMKAGAVDFLVKPFSDRDMLDAVASAMARDSEARARRSQMEELRERLATLSHRERQVMARVAQGRMNKQIATELAIAEITVKIYRANAMKKMGARSVVDLVRMAEALGGRPFDSGFVEASERSYAHITPM